jgi:hypothetical protein
MRRTLTNLSSYSRNHPLERRGSSGIDVGPCLLIVDATTANEIDSIRHGTSMSQAYSLESDDGRDLNEIVDVLNGAIQAGNVPYYWSQSQRRYYPIIRALRLERAPNVGFSAKESTYQVIVRVGSLERPVNIHSICSIDEVPLESPSADGYQSPLSYYMSAAGRAARNVVATGFAGYSMSQYRPTQSGRRILPPNDDREQQNYRPIGRRDFRMS